MITLYILGAFSVATALLSGYFNFTEKPRLRLFAKLSASVLFMAVALIATLNAQAATTYYVFVLAALIFGMLGDIFLVLPKLANEKGESVFELYGIGTFFIGHIFYIILFLMLAETYNPWLIILIVFFPITLFVLYKIKFLTLSKVKLFACLAYGVVLGLMASSVINLYNTKQTTRGLVILIAGLLFTLSDTCLCVRLFKENKTRTQKIILTVAVSLTYYTAQVLFAISIAI
jgi:uncharacterized membrane protein YhhN